LGEDLPVPTVHEVVWIPKPIGAQWVTK